MPSLVHLLCLLLAVRWLASAAIGTSLDPLQLLVEELRHTRDPALQFDLLKGMEEGFQGRRNLPMPAGWESLANDLNQSTNTAIRKLTQDLSFLFGSSRAVAILKTDLLNTNRLVAVRKEALLKLAERREPELLPVLFGLLDDPALRIESLRALTRFEDREIPRLVLERLPLLPPTERREALATLVSRPSFARVLLAAIEQNRVSARDLTADLVQQLRAMKDPAFAPVLERFWGKARETDADKAAEVRRYKELLTGGQAGDPRRGRAVYNQVCHQCHELFDTGGKVGPNLTGANRSDLDYLLQNIVDPNAVVPNDYRSTTVETRDDRVLTGVVARQDTHAVTLLTATETLVIPRNEIQSLHQGELSMMPEGLLSPLEPRDVRDLLTYLASPVQVPAGTNGSEWLAGETPVSPPRP